MDSPDLIYYLAGAFLALHFFGAVFPGIIASIVVFVRRRSNG